MKMDSIINRIVRDKDGNEFRVININSTNNVVYIINVNEKSLPNTMEIDDMIEKINRGILKVLDYDDYMVVRRECDLKDSEKEYREEIFDIIYPIISNGNINLYDKKLLNKLINDIANKNAISKRSVKRYLIRYLVRGQCKNALIPDFYKCGGLNNEKKLTDKKTGRPRLYNKKQGPGINTTDEIKEIFKKAVKEFVTKGQDIDISDIYYLMIGEYFVDSKGNIKPENQLPTVEQFKYWYNKYISVKEEYVSRGNLKEYNLKVRPLIGTSLDRAQYPSHVFQIDSTIGDVKLVSTINRKDVIGRPTIYLVTDVFSRMITGFYAGLENPSWCAAMMAIYNCALDKVKLCNKYGIEIKEDEWNSCDLPEILVCDRGSEFTGQNIENMANCLNIDIKNAPSYRPDLKGIVERLFRKINSEFKKFLLGAVKSPIKERGEKDPAEFAYLDINQINRIIIACIIEHNNHFMNNYERNNNMKEESVPSVPTKIWEWGMKNITGYKPKLSENIIKLGLMPRDKATVTGRGIRFKKIYYICDKAIEEAWFDRARKNKSWKVDIVYDPRNMNNIYLIKDKSVDYIICSIKENESEYLNKTYDEIIYLDKLEKELASEYKYNNIEKKVQKNNKIKEETKSAEDINKEYILKTGQTKNNTKQVRENRQIERKRLSSNNALKLDGDYKNPSIKESITKNEVEINNENNINIYEDEDEDEAILDKKLKNRKNKLSKKLYEYQNEKLNNGDKGNV